jgi:predicted dehydrogenase
MKPKVLLLGMGNRGHKSYGKFALEGAVDMEISAICDADPERLAHLRGIYGVPESMVFGSWEDALSQKLPVDATIVSLPDNQHRGAAIQALDNGNHVLLEKPIDNSPQGCMDIVKAQERSGKVLSVAHVLRYTPFFEQIKEVVESGELGDLRTVDLKEEVGYWHFAHSYTRGNWRNEAESGPVLLTKSCHDLDIISWLVGDVPKTISSRGSLDQFRADQAPDGSGMRCLDDCAVEDSCPYSARKIYLETNEKDLGVTLSTIAFSTDLEEREGAIREGPYGRCVYQCDNDVCDNQNVAIDFENGARANFQLRAGGEDPTRDIEIYFEKGKLQGDILKGEIKVIPYSGVRRKSIARTEELDAKGEHAGSDLAFTRDFIEAVRSGNSDDNLTSAQESLQSHLMVFAAEASRKSGLPVNYDSFVSKYR